MGITGKWEFEVGPGSLRTARTWVNRMQRKYEAEVGQVRFLTGSAAENGFSFDDSVRGFLDPKTRQVAIFYAEERDLASLAEELAHYFQYKQQRLLGKTEAQIGEAVIDRNERQMKVIMLSHGFRVRR